MSVFLQSANCIAATYSLLSGPKRWYDKIQNESTALKEIYTDSSWKELTADVYTTDDKTSYCSITKLPEHEKITVYYNPKLDELSTKLRRFLSLQKIMFDTMMDPASKRGRHTASKRAIMVSSATTCCTILTCFCWPTLVIPTSIFFSWIKLDKKVHDEHNLQHFMYSIQITSWTRRSDKETLTEMWYFSSGLIEAYKDLNENSLVNKRKIEFLNEELSGFENVAAALEGTFLPEGFHIMKDEKKLNKYKKFHLEIAEEFTKST